MTTTKKKTMSGPIDLPLPVMAEMEASIVGTAPYVSNNFGDKAREQMRDTQAAGEEAAKAKKRGAVKPPKDFDESFEESLHRHAEGWCGIPTTAFLSAIIRACKGAGLVMADAKGTITIVPDGYSTNGTPLVRILDREPVKFETYVKLANGAPDIKARGKFDVGWRCVLKLKFDAKQYTARTIMGLVQRAGMFVGVGAGRPMSTNSAGQGWGTWTVIAEAAPTEQVAAE